MSKKSCPKYQQNKMFAHDLKYKYQYLYKYQQLNKSLTVTGPQFIYTLQ